MARDFARGEHIKRPPSILGQQNNTTQQLKSSRDQSQNRSTPSWENRGPAWEAWEGDTPPPIPEHLKSDDWIDRHIGTLQQPEQKNLFSQNGDRDPSQTGQTTDKKQGAKPLDPAQDKKKLAWVSPLDMLDYLGLGIDVVERAYIEMGMKPGQEKEFARFANTLYFVIDAAMAILPGAGGGGLAVRASHEAGELAWHALPASSKAKVIQEIAKKMGWPAAKASQAVNVFFSMKAGKGNGKDVKGGGKDGKGSGNKRPADLPSSKKINYDWDHIFDGHWEGTPAKSRGNNTVFWGLNKNQIQAVIRDAYKNVYKKLQTQGDKIRVMGKSGKWDIEMWVNKKTNRVETAYPKQIKK